MIQDKRNLFEVHVLNNPWGDVLENFDYVVDGDTITYTDATTEAVWRSFLVGFEEGRGHVG